MHEQTNISRAVAQQSSQTAYFVIYVTKIVLPANLEQIIIGYKKRLCL